MLTTARLDLIPLEVERDFEDLHEMFADPLWAEYNDVSADHAATRGRLEKEFGDNGSLAWVLRLRPPESGDASGRRVIGLIGVFSDQGTPIRGLSWYLRHDHWGRGLMSEAALMVVDHLLTLPGIDGIEAWIDSRNTRSIGVARGARLDLVGRLPRVAEHQTAQWVVMARAARPSDPVVIGIRPTLLVHDVAKTAELLVEVLGLRVAFQVGLDFARLCPTPWNAGPVIELRLTAEEAQPVPLEIDVGVAVDPIHEAVLTAGLKVSAPPANTPWYRREFTFQLAEGHLLTVSGPSAAD